MGMSTLIQQSGIAAVKYDLYFKFEQEYKRLMNAYHTAFAEAQSDPVRSANWPRIYAQYHEKISIAYDNWLSYGYKNEVEQAFSRAQSITAHKCFPVVLKKFIPTPALV